MGVTFNHSSNASVKKLDEYLLTRSYISGYLASKDDLIVYVALARPPSSKYVDASRCGVCGEGCGVTVEGSAPIIEETVATPAAADTKAADEEDDDDSDVDLFGEETKEGKKVAEDRAAAVKAGEEEGM